MSGTLDRLVRMANQIATELGHQTGDRAAQATWDHLWHFWDPSMRDAIVAHLDAGGEGLSPIASEAVAMLRSPDVPARQ